MSGASVPGFVGLRPGEPVIGNLRAEGSPSPVRGEGTPAPCVRPCVRFSDREIEAVENTFGERWPAAAIIPRKAFKWRFSIPCMDDVLQEAPLASAECVGRGEGTPSPDWGEGTPSPLEFRFVRKGPSGRALMDVWRCASPFAVGDVLHLSEPVFVRAVCSAAGVGFSADPKRWPVPFKGTIEIERVRLEAQPFYAQFAPSRYVKDAALADAVAGLGAAGVGLWPKKEATAPAWARVLPREFASFDRLEIASVSVQRVAAMRESDLEGEGCVPNASRFSDADKPSRERVLREDFRANVLGEKWPELASAADVWVFVYEFKRRFADAMAEQK